jgi:hypothetical protein
MLRFLKSFFGKQTPPAPEVPYKVEAPTLTPVPAVEVAPQPVQCGCGRSPTGFCVGLHKLSPAEWDVHPDNPVKPVAEVKAPAKKAAAKKPAAPKKPAAKKPAAPKKPAAKK